MRKNTIRFTLSVLFVIGFASAALALTDEERLGQLLYFDKDLSKYQNQSCASCHLPSSGFVDPDNVLDPYNNVVSIGSDTSLNGGRNAPTSGYAAFIPKFSGDSETGYNGGQFWNGRLDTLKDQAKGPFLNPVEMGMADEAEVVSAIADSGNKNFKFYNSLFASLYGIDLTSYDDPITVFDHAAQAIAVFEQSCRFHKFSSKYDYSLSGQATLTASEENGRVLFEANCASCHPSTAVETVLPLFSTYDYYNLGIPKSENVLIADFLTDYGLGDGENKLVTDLDAQKGKFRVPSLRNIVDTPPYGHNGYFANLKDFIHYLNTAQDDSWTHEVGDDYVPNTLVWKEVGHEKMGNMGLTEDQEYDLVAFLETLSDGDTCQLPTGYVMPEMTPLTDLNPVAPPVSGGQNQWGKQ